MPPNLLKIVWGLCPWTPLGAAPQTPADGARLVALRTTELAVSTMARAARAPQVQAPGVPGTISIVTPLDYKLMFGLVSSAVSV